jgi:hypothetical protein
MKQLKEIMKDKGMNFDEAAKIYDLVNKPKHYNNGGVECIQYIKQQLGANFPSYLEGSIIKYIHRHKYKDANIQDLQKAKWYLEKLIDHYENL